MSSTRNHIIRFIQQDLIKPENVDDALLVSGLRPNSRNWYAFIDKTLLILGGLSLAFSLMFFVAYNWNDIGKFAKFGLVQFAIIGAIGCYWKLGADKLSAKVSLLVGAILVGVLLALYGQTYQTGADPWQLFFSWALLLIPWALLGRFAAIWVVWLLLVNLSLVLYHQTIRGAFWLLFDAEESLLWLLFIFNGLALITWEVLIPRFEWLSTRWAVRLLAMVSGSSITWLVILAIFESRNSDFVSILIWLCWMPTLYFVYRKIRQDLFMLAGMCLSGIMVVISFLSHAILNGFEAGGFLLIAIVLIGIGSGATVWLKKVHQEWQS